MRREDKNELARDARVRSRAGVRGQASANLLVMFARTLEAAFVVGALSLAAAAHAKTPQVVTPTHSTQSSIVLPFIADDYARALKVARAKHLPVFIEAWAPW
jgi:hypothetical protein